MRKEITDILHINRTNSIAKYFGYTNIDKKE